MNFNDLSNSTNVIAILGYSSYCDYVFIVCSVHTACDVSGDEHFYESTIK